MICSWCHKRISILRTLTDSHYCCDQHRKYATMSGPALQREDARRRRRRYAVDAGVVQASWLDVNGSMKTRRIRVLNISEDGIALQVPEEVMPLMVKFQSDQWNVEGTGVVRQCRRAGDKYVVGLEFTEGLRWQAPAGDVQEPISLCEPRI
jgi:hypothetical protein